MLYDIIRDFYVLHVWGGTLSTGTIIKTRIGTGRYFDSPGHAVTFDLSSNQYIFKFAEVEGQNYYLSIGDWLSTTSTIITMVVILVCIAFFIRWIFKVCSNAILLR